MQQIGDLKLSSSAACQEVSEILKCLILTEEDLERISKTFKSEMEAALKMQPSSLQMENTYIPELPDGTENGVFLALDLGGTNLRVLLVSLENGMVVKETVQQYPIGDDLRIGCGNKLFDYLAACIDSFAKEYQLEDNTHYPLGFTFSFPMHQHALDSATLVTWTKSFNCTDVVGHDAVEKLRESLLKVKRTNIEVLAVLNDTTGTLMQGAFLNKRTRIGIVLGTGCNGCYLEHANRVEHWEQKRHGEHHVVIDVEWGAFGDNGVLDFIKTDFDRELDNDSLLKNSFTFEKYVGGKYLGELCRLILKRLHQRKLFLKSLPSQQFPKPWKFDSENVSKIEHDNANKSNINTNVILQKIVNGGVFTPDDSAIIRHVCGLISLRAAQLLAINTAALLNRMDGETDITVAIDGSVYKHHPRLRHWVGELTTQWAPDKNSKFMLAEDGSGKGAALVAAIAKKLQTRGY